MMAQLLPHLCIKDVLNLDRVMRVKLLCIFAAIMEHLDNVAVLKQLLQLS